MFYTRKTHAEIPGMWYGLDKSLGIQAFKVHMELMWALGLTKIFFQ